MYRNQLLYRYFSDWVDTYKRGAVRPITLSKYLVTTRRLKELAPSQTIGSLDRPSYQRILNLYARSHERATVMNFHHQVRASIQDALADGLIRRDPTWKAIIKGKSPDQGKKKKFLGQSELKRLLEALNLSDPTDLLLFLIARTGLRFGEALAVTPADIDNRKHLLTINKAWNYKSPTGGFIPTKNQSSNRTVLVDEKTCNVLCRMAKNRDPSSPLLVDRTRRVFNATINQHLKDLCLKAGVSVVSVHGLRHTYASILLYAGVSIPSVARQLGHANMSTTEKTYLHVIQELRSRDDGKVAAALSLL